MVGLGEEWGAGPAEGSKAGEAAPSDNLYVSDLPAGTTEDSLRAMFGPGVTQCRVLPPKSPGQSTCVALVRFQSAKEAALVRETLNGAIPPGQQRPVSIRFCGKPEGKGGAPSYNKMAAAAHQARQSPYGSQGGACGGASHDDWDPSSGMCKGGGGKGGQAGAEGPQPNDNLYVTGLPPGIDTESLKGLFGQYGTVTQCKVLPSPTEGKATHALVRFASIDEAAAVKKALTGYALEGVNEPLVVEFALQKPRFEGGQEFFQKGGPGGMGSKGWNGKGGFDGSWSGKGGCDGGQAEEGGKGGPGGGWGGKGYDDSGKGGWGGKGYEEGPKGGWGGKGYDDGGKGGWGGGKGYDDGSKGGWGGGKGYDDGSKGGWGSKGGDDGGKGGWGGKGYEDGGKGGWGSKGDSGKGGWGGKGGEGEDGGKGCGKAGGKAGGKACGKKGGKDGKDGQGGMDVILQGFVEAQCLPGHQLGNEDNCLFISGLPKDTDDIHLYRLLAPFGGITPTGVKAMKFPDGTCKGFGFVNFVEDASRQAAAAMLHGTQLPDGSTMSVVPKRKKGSGKGKDGCKGPGDAADAAGAGMSMEGMEQWSGEGGRWDPGEMA